MKTSQGNFDEVVRTGKGRTEELICRSSFGERMSVRMVASVPRHQGDDCLLIVVQDQRDQFEAEKRAQKLQSDLHHGARLSAMPEMVSCKRNKDVGMTICSHCRSTSGRARIPNTKNVFFVDDDEAGWESLAVLLETLGHTVATFESGHAFLEAL